MILSCEMLTLNESCKVAHRSMWNGPRVLCEGNFGEVRTCCEMLFMLLTFNM